MNSISFENDNNKHIQMKILNQIQTRYNDDIKQRHNRLSKPIKFNVSMHSLIKALNINGKIKSTKKILMSASILKSKRKHKNRFYQSNYNEYNYNTNNYSFINTKLHFIPFSNESLFPNKISSNNIEQSILSLSKKDCDLTNILKCNIIPKIQNELFKKKNLQQHHSLQLIHNKFHTIKNIHYTFCKIRYITLCKSKEIKIESHFTNPNEVFENSIFSGKVFQKKFKLINHCPISSTKHIINKSMIKESDIKDLLHLNTFNNNIKCLSFIENKYNISLEQSSLHQTKELLLNLTCIDTILKPISNNENKVMIYCSNTNNISSKEKNFHFHNLPLLFRSEYTQHTRKNDLLTLINSYTHSDTRILNLMQVNSTSNIFYLQPSPHELSSHIRNLTFPSSVNYSSLFHNQTQTKHFSIKPLPQLNIESTFKTKRSYNAYSHSQQCKQTATTSTVQSDPIILNKLTIGSVYTYKKNNFIYCDTIQEDIDIIFDIDVCGLFFSSSDLADEFELNAFEEMFQIINASYTSYSTFYVIILDDQRNKMIPDYSVRSVIDRVHAFLNTKFNALLNQQILVYKIKTVRNIAEMHICLANILHEIKGNLNMYSLYNVSNYNDILNLLYSKVNKDNSMLEISNDEWKGSKYVQLNTIEKIMCALIHKEQDKEHIYKQLKEMIVQVITFNIYINII